MPDNLTPDTLRDADASSNPPTTWTRPAWLALTAVGGALAFLAASQGWWTVPDATVAVKVTGSTASSGLAAVLPAAVLAAGLLGLVVRRVGRLIAGLLAVLLSAGAVALGIVRPRPDRLMTNTPMPANATYQGTAWPWLYLGAGVLMLAGAVLLAVCGPRWPARTAARFERSAADDPAAWWKELDAGHDPTDADVADSEGADPAVADAETSGSGTPGSVAPDGARET